MITDLPLLILGGLTELTVVGDRREKRAGELVCWMGFKEVGVTERPVLDWVDLTQRKCF